jgi:hypothetical protein
LLDQHLSDVIWREISNIWHYFSLVNCYIITIWSIGSCGVPRNVPSDVEGRNCGVADVALFVSDLNSLRKVLISDDLDQRDVASVVWIAASVIVIDTNNVCNVLSDCDARLRGLIDVFGDVRCCVEEVVVLLASF